MSPRARRSDAAPASVAALSRFAIEAGNQLREMRVGRRWTLRQLAEQAGVSVATAQAAEAGRPVSLETYARLSTTLGSRPAISFESRHKRSRPVGEATATDLVHGAMAEIEARQVRRPGVTIAIDEPYQHYQFAGRADVLAWNSNDRTLLHIENKTRLIDIQELAGTFNAKKAYLPGVVADRAAIGPRGWQSVTHALVVLWSSEVLHVLRLRPATFHALCPAPSTAFEDWWSGRSPAPGVTSCLVVMDPLPALSSRSRRFVGSDRVATIAPRYRGYADAATKIAGRS